jgi:8-oxo-dGTP pyrophosphatase MutT (NUDIX family)
MFDSLLAIYGDLATVVQRGGRVYPAAIQHDVGGSMASLVERSNEPLLIDGNLRGAGEAHLQAVAARSPGMHDGSVEACVTAAGFPLRSAPGGYFDAIATSDSLRAEYVKALADRTGLASLPLRTLAHQASGGDPLRSGQGRVAAIGVSVAVILPWGASRGLVLGLRSSDLATDPGMWHIAPSGTLEPGGEDPVIRVVKRELAEELNVHLDSEDDLAGRLEPLGIGFDLLRLRPEICLRLELQDAEAPSSGPVLSSLEFQERALVETSGTSMAAFWQSHPPEILTPAAAAAIALLEEVSLGP